MNLTTKSEVFLQYLPVSTSSTLQKHIRFDFKLDIMIPETNRYDVERAATQIYVSYY